MTSLKGGGLGVRGISPHMGPFSHGGRSGGEKIDS